jgi:hypothetical protein
MFIAHRIGNRTYIRGKITPKFTECPHQNSQSFPYGDYILWGLLVVVLEILGQWRSVIEVLPQETQSYSAIPARFLSTGVIQHGRHLFLLHDGAGYCNI